MQPQTYISTAEPQQLRQAIFTGVIASQPEVR